MMVGLPLIMAVLAAAAEEPPAVATLTPMPAAPAPIGSAPAPDTNAATPSASVNASGGRCEAPYRLQRKSRSLQRRLEAKLASANLTRFTRKHRLSVALVDITRPDDIYYAGINDDDMMYAASLPKIAILLAVAEAANRGDVLWTPEYDARLSSMITESSNANATWGAERVGLRRIADVMRDPRYCFYDNVSGGLWVGRYYGPSPEELRDPLMDLAHAATARQAARFYLMLDREDLVSTEWSQHMLRLMGPPKHNHKFVGGLSDRSNITFLARKSGTWRNWHSDSALIQHGDNRYIAVGLSELRNGEGVMQELIRLLDDIVADGSYRRPRKQPHS